MKSVGIVFNYHIGTVVAHVFITIIFWPFSFILNKLYSILSNARQSSLINRFIMVCCVCCLQFWQKILRYFDQSAFIHTIMWCTPYYASAKLSYFLILRNKDRIGPIIWLVSFLIKLTKITTGLIGMLTVYWLIKFNS